MVPLVTLILLIAILAFVGYPLIRPAARGDAAAMEPVAGQLAQLLAERENAVAALTDLEFEHGIGNLTDGDYAALRAAQRHKAMAILAELARLGQGAAPAGSDLPVGKATVGEEERLEAAIARARRRLAVHEGAGEGASGEQDVRCAGCGMLLVPGARFCSACGQPRGAAVDACPSCGAPQTRHDRFCAACGAAIEQEAHDR